MPVDRLTLDHIDDIVVSQDMHQNNLNVLYSLDIGMFQLASFIRHREITALEKHGKDRIVFLGKVTEETLFIGCIFDWFAISMVSYMSTIKLMQLLEENQWDLSRLQDRANQEKLHEARSTYVERVAPEVLEWRNKIAAHRVATDPRSDNLSTLTYSTMPTVTYRSPYYRVADFKITIGDGGPSDLQSWSLRACLKNPVW